MIKPSWLRDGAFWDLRVGDWEERQAEEETAPAPVPLVGPLVAPPHPLSAKPGAVQALLHQVALSSLKLFSPPCGKWRNQSLEPAGLMFRKEHRHSSTGCDNSETHMSYW